MQCRTGPIRYPTVEPGHYAVQVGNELNFDYTLRYEPLLALENDFDYPGRFARQSDGEHVAFVFEAPALDEYRILVTMDEPFCFGRAEINILNPQGELVSQVLQVEDCQREAVFNRENQNGEFQRVLRVDWTGELAGGQYILEFRADSLVEDVGMRFEAPLAPQMFPQFHNFGGLSNDASFSHRFSVNETGTYLLTTAGRGGNVARCPGDTTLSLFVRSERNSVRLADNDDWAGSVPPICSQIRRRLESEVEYTVVVGADDNAWVTPGTLVISRP
jgi:hypothetical protein